MRTSRPRRFFRPRAALLLILFGLCQIALSQEGPVALLQPEAIRPTIAQPASTRSASVLTPVEPATVPEAPSHRFWDRKNSLLFATSAAFSAADFVVTRDNLRSGGQELNPVTRVFSGSTAGLAVNFAGETAGVVGISYVFHRTGHHKLERVVSMLNIGASGTAVMFDLAHR